MEVQGERRLGSSCCSSLVEWISWCSFCGSSSSYGQGFMDGSSVSSHSSPLQQPSIATSSRHNASPGNERLSLLPKGTELRSSHPNWTEANKLQKWGTEEQLRECKKDKMGDLVKNNLGSGLSLAISDDGEMCSTCLEPYTEENPAIWTKCNHHFHLACIYEWLERKQTCPICNCEMSFEEILD